MLKSASCLLLLSARACVTTLQRLRPRPAAALMILLCHLVRSRAADSAPPMRWPGDTGGCVRDPSGRPRPRDSDRSRRACQRPRTAPHIARCGTEHCGRCPSAGLATHAARCALPRSRVGGLPGGESCRYCRAPRPNCHDGSSRRGMRGEKRLAGKRRPGAAPGRQGWAERTGQTGRSTGTASQPSTGLGGDRHAAEQGQIADLGGQQPNPVGDVLLDPGGRHAG